MKQNYYLHGGIEKHHDGSFTIYGTYYDYQIGSDVLYHKRYYYYSVSEAIKLAKNEIKQLSKRGA